MPSTRIAGFYDEHSFDVEFEALPFDVAHAFHEVAAGLEGPALETHRAVMLATAARAWCGVVDEARAEIPFSVEAFMDLLAHPSVLAGVAKAYREELLGSSN